MENLKVIQRWRKGMKDFNFEFTAANMLAALVGFIVLLLWIKTLHDVCPLVMP